MPNPSGNASRRQPQRTFTRTTIYDQEYFSSSQVNLYFGDVVIDECTSLQVMLNQTKRPIYGYASQLFDATAKGTLLVQGSFQINFKESGYLYTVLNRLRRLEAGRGTPLISPFVSNKNIGRVDVRGAKRGKDLGGVFQANIEQVLSAEEAIQRGELTREQQIAYYESLTRLNNEVSGFNNPDGALPGAEDLFETFENQIWGRQQLDKEPRRVDDNAFDGFTIYVTYGDFNTNDRINHTARRIDGVRLVGQAQTIMNDGKPVGEGYQFIARNWV